MSTQLLLYVVKNYSFFFFFGYFCHFEGLTYICTYLWESTHLYIVRCFTLYLYTQVETRVYVTVSASEGRLLNIFPHSKATARSYLNNSALCYSWSVWFFSEAERYMQHYLPEMRTRSGPSTWPAKTTCKNKRSSPSPDSHFTLSVFFFFFFHFFLLFSKRRLSSFFFFFDFRDWCEKVGVVQ